MNPLGLMKLVNEKKEVTENHPKFIALLRRTFGNKMAEGTKITITVTKPGKEPETETLTVQKSDLKFFKGLQGLFG